MVDTYRLLLLQTLRALQAADREVDFFGLSLVWMPDKFVDPSQTGQSPFDRGVAVVHCHGFNVSADTG